MTSNRTLAQYIHIDDYNNLYNTQVYNMSLGSYSCNRYSVTNYNMYIYIYGCKWLKCFVCYKTATIL